jgi:hypothetical protein
VDSYIAHANIDHYFNLLTSQDLTDRNRATIMKLMVAEEDKLGRRLEHLQFAEVRTASARDRVNYLSKLRDSFADGSAERIQAEKVLANFEAIYQLMEQFCRRMRKTVNSAHI